MLVEIKLGLMHQVEELGPMMEDEEDLLQQAHDKMLVEIVVILLEGLVLFLDCYPDVN
jgi:hypothetical protein